MKSFLFVLIMFTLLNLYLQEFKFSRNLIVQIILCASVLYFVAFICALVILITL